MIRDFISTLLARFQSEDEEGQTLVEYGLLLALIAIIVIVALLFLGPFVSDIFSNVGNQLAVDCRHLRRRNAPELRPRGVVSVSGHEADPDRSGKYHPPVLAHKSTRDDLPGVRRLLTAVTTRALLAPHLVLIHPITKGNTS